MFSMRLAACACLALTLGYGGWSYTRTFGDPDASADVTRALLERPAVVDALAGGAGPLAVPLRHAGIDAEGAEALVRDALKNPTLVDAMADATRTAHGDLVNGEQRVRLRVPGAALTAAAREAAGRQQIDPSRIPELGDVGVEVPSAERLGQVDVFARRWTQVLGVAALLAAAALFVAERRGLVLRRIGRTVAISATLSLAFTLLAAHFTKSSGSTLLATGGAVSEVWRARTQPALLWAAAVGALTWAVGVMLLNSAVPARLKRNGAAGRRSKTDKAAIPRVDARGNPIRRSSRDELPEYDPWVDGTTRGGRFTTAPGEGRWTL